MNLTITQQFLRTRPLAELEATYAIKSKRHGEFPNLVMLKYDQINSPMHEPIVQECRGLILDEADDWKIVSYPFRKFFNHGEPNAVQIDWTTAKVFEKLDGSLMTLYWYRDEWRVASSGTPDAGGTVNPSAITFAELFWRTFRELGYQLPGVPSQGGPVRCFMFELMTPINRIVVQHETSRLVLLGARTISAGADDLREVPADEAASGFGWQFINCFPLGTIADCIEAASKLTGLNGEGFVVCDAHFNRIKIKSPKYVALAHMKESMTPRRMLEVVRANESEEFLSYFPEMRPMYERVRDRFMSIVAELESDLGRIAGIELQKDFAMQAVKSKCSGALFAVRNGKAQSIRHYFAAAPMPAVERVMLEGIEG